MPRLAQLQAHIASMGELRNVVGAMRALASMRMQEALRAKPGAGSYAQAIADAVADSLLPMRVPPLAPGQSPRTAAVLFMAEHGFVGSFNQRIIDAARLTPDRDAPLFVLGTRGAALLAEQGYRAAWARSMASRCTAAPETVHALSVQLYRHIAAGEIDRVEMVYAGYHSGGPASIEKQLLLPLDTRTLGRRQLRQAPLRNLEPEPLHRKLLAEYVFALLVRAAIESIASENASRFQAMAAAYENISDRMDVLLLDANHARQSEITMELLDLLTGSGDFAQDGERNGLNIGFAP